MGRTELEAAREELERLRGQAAEQGARIRMLESGEQLTPSGLVAAKTQSRRDLLRLAGAAGIAAAGAVGMTAINARPAHAATGGNMVLGSTNVAEDSTILSYDGSATNTALQVNTSGATASTVYGMSVAGKNTLDLKLTGTGRFGQTPMSLSGGGGPSATVGTWAEIARGNDGSMWATRGDSSHGVGAGNSGSAAWKRMNTWRVDKQDGSGAPFAPIRIINTLDGTGGVNAPMQPGVSVEWPSSFAGLYGIPATATGIFGNITAFLYNQSGFLIIYAGGSALPNVSSVNYGAGQGSWGNFFVTAFGTGSHAGKISIFNSNNGGTQVIVDVFGYIE